MTADDVLRQAIQGISDLILVPGMINLDFADVKTIMAGMGIAMMGTGIADGEHRAIDAAQRAISSPLLEGASVQGARGVIINVTGGPDLSLLEVSEASTIIQEAAHEDANIIFGAVIDPELGGRVKITVIATGFDRVDSRPATTTQSTTPVDLAQYSTRTKAVEPPAAMAMSRTITRRSTVSLSPPMAMAAGAEDQAIEGMEEPSPLDVPAFLRRQHEG
jgi:cell division protein FtsZ